MLWGRGKARKKRELKLWNGEKTKERHASERRARARQLWTDSPRQRERQGKQTQLHAHLPHQKAFSSKCQGSWISGLPAFFQSRARLHLTVWFAAPQTSTVRRACTAVFLWVTFEMQLQLEGGGGGPFLFLRCVTERQTDWHLEKYIVGTQQRLCSHDYDLSPQVSIRLIRTDQSLFSHSSEGRVNRLYPTCPLLGEQGLQFMAVLWGCWYIESRKENTAFVCPGGEMETFQRSDIMTLTADDSPNL